MQNIYEACTGGLAANDKLTAMRFSSHKNALDKPKGL